MQENPDGSVGLLGVGFSDPEFGTANSWILEAYQRELIPSPVYSLTLGRYDSNSLSEGSLMVIGGYDEEQVDGALNWIHTSGNIHVQVPMDGVIVNGVTLVREDGLPMQAIIDVLPKYLFLLTIVRYRRNHCRTPKCRTSGLRHPWRA